MNVNFLKNNKNIIIAVIVLFIILIGIMEVKDFLMPNTGAASYGNRLDGKVELTKNVSKKISELINNEAEISVRTAGRIVNVTINVKDEATRDSGKTYANKALEAFTEEEKAYYDFQFFLTKKKEDAAFPVIGYKNQTSKSITWTKDR